MTFEQSLEGGERVRRTQEGAIQGEEEKQRHKQAC